MASILDWDPSFARLDDYGTIVIDPSDYTSLLPARPVGNDPDTGPYCWHNQVLDKYEMSPWRNDWIMYTGHWILCHLDRDCTAIGCCKWEETEYKSNVWVPAPHGCAPVFPWWYAAGPPGNRTMLVCPKFDNVTSTFTFRGEEFVNFMEHIGHILGEHDCHRNIMCSPTTHYFDDTQHDTLKWCQETPVGMYSPQCNNTLLPCTPMGDMRMRYFSSHGYGDPEGCEVRSIAPALVAADPFDPSSAVFSLRVYVELDISQPWPAMSQPAQVFGLLNRFMVGIQPTGEDRLVRLALFHRDWTVRPDAAILLTEPIDWADRDTRRYLVIEGNGAVIRFSVDGEQVASFLQEASTADIGAFNVSGLPSDIVNGTSMHVGFMAVGLESDYINGTAPHPYTTELFARMSVSDIVALGSLLTTTTTTTSTEPPPTTTWYGGGDEEDDEEDEEKEEEEEEIITETSTSNTPVSIQEWVIPVTEPVLRKLTTTSPSPDILHSGGEPDPSLVITLAVTTALVSLTLILVCVYNYRCAGPLTIERRGHRTVPPVGPAEPLSQDHEIRGL
jgi:hypothetical protein